MNDLWEVPGSSPIGDKNLPIKKKKKKKIMSGEDIVILTGVRPQTVGRLFIGPLAIVVDFLI